MNEKDKNPGRPNTRNTSATTAASGPRTPTGAKTPKGADGNKTAKTPKTPVATQVSMDENVQSSSADTQLILRELGALTTKIDKLETKIDNFEHRVERLQNNVIQIEKSVEFSNEQSSEALSRVQLLEKTVKEQHDEIELFKKRLSQTDSKLLKLHEKNLEMDTYNRKVNLLFHGLPQEDNENCTEKVKKFMTEQLAMSPEDVQNINIQKCHRLPGKAKPNAVICRFANMPDRELVFSQKTKLYGTGLRISENFPEEISRRRRTLFPIMSSAMKMGKKAMMKYDKLVIEGKKYSVDTLGTLPPELNPAYTATKTVDDVTCFFSLLSPLSNFHQVRFQIDQKEYSCVEEYMQSEKALFVQRPDIAQQIKQASHPREMKHLGDSVMVDMNEWLPKAKDVVYKACHAKFSQNPVCRQFLLDTEDNLLAEAGPDQIWGTGIMMTSEKAFDKNWPGQNILGQILMKIRDELS